MRVLVQKKELLKPLRLMNYAKFINLKKEILVFIEDDSLCLIDSDGKQTLELRTDANIIIEKRNIIGISALVVPTKMFLDVLRGLEEGEIEIEIEDLKMSITQGNYSISFPGTNLENYPRTELLESPRIVSTLSIATLIKLLNFVDFAICKDKDRLKFAGLFCQFFPDEMRMVATDGHKLALLKRKDIFNIKNPLEILIPKNAISRLKALLKKSKSNHIEFIVDYESVQFLTEDFLFQTKLILEKFPEYERVIPSDDENSLVMICERKELNKSVKLMNISASKMTSRVKFKMSKGSVEMASSDLDTDSEGSNTLTVDYDGEPLEIAFNGKDLLEILKHMSSDQIKFKLKYSASPCIITPFSQSENFEYLTLIMPLRIN